MSCEEKNYNGFDGRDSECYGKTINHKRKSSTETLNRFVSPYSVFFSSPLLILQFCSAFRVFNRVFNFNFIFESISSIAKLSHVRGLHRACSNKVNLGLSEMVTGLFSSVFISSVA